MKNTFWIKVKTIRETVDIYRISDFENKLFESKKYIKLNKKTKYKKYMPHVEYANTMCEFVIKRNLYKSESGNMSEKNVF